MRENTVRGTGGRARRGVVLATVLACACGGADDVASRGGEASGAPAPVIEAPAAPPPSSPAPAEEARPAPPPPLRARFLGVAGFLIERGDDAILTAPLFTRPSMIKVMTGEIASEGARVDAALSPAELSRVRAVISGHAHYDHLLDVPSVMTRAPSATLFSNASARHLLAALAPDRAPACVGRPAPPSTVARSRVVALDDPASSRVDYQSCPSLKPEGAPLVGRWTAIPGASARVMAFCSEHPDQFGPVHFGAGHVTEDACELPKKAADWKEGRTLSFLVDFLDPKTGAPQYRVFYEDAPTDAPVGHVPASILAERRVDLALLCVGAYESVGDAPRSILSAMNPRFALGGHWEDFFEPESASPKPIPFTDVKKWEQHAAASLGAPEPSPWAVNGTTARARVVLPKPGDTLVIPR